MPGCGRSGYDGGGPYNALFRRLSHWLMKEPDLEEEFLTAHAKGRTLTIERRSMGDNRRPLSSLTSPTGEEDRLIDPRKDQVPASGAKRSRPM